MRRHMGMVFQYSALFDSMTIRENVAFGLRQHARLPEADVQHIVREKLRMVGLDADEIGGLMPSSLSGGMKKRVSLARATALDPGLILYDEPTAGLDPKERVRLRELLAGMAQDRIILVATHVVSDVESVATKVILLRAGKIVDAAPVPDLIAARRRGRGLQSGRAQARHPRSCRRAAKLLW